MPYSIQRISPGNLDVQYICEKMKWESKYNIIAARKKGIRTFAGKLLMDPRRINRIILRNPKN
jgi:hypothetical protein